MINMEAVLNLIESYNDDSDWRKKENANKYDSYSKLRAYIADAVIKEYAFTRIYPEDIVELHKSGFIHIHDLSDAVVPYCKGHDPTDLLVRGLITNTVVSYPPKHLNSFFNQLINYLVTAQQEWAGAQAIPDLNTLAAPFVRSIYNFFKEFVPNEKHLNYIVKKLVKQAVQSLVFDMNFPSRGPQTAFLNIMLNLRCPDHLKDRPVFNVGCEGVYGDYEKEARMILEAFNEVMYEGDAAGNPFTFPLITIALLPDTNFDDPLWVEMMKTELKYGTYSFHNYIGTGTDPNSVFSMCCRLSLDLTQLPPTGGRWVYEGGTGSLGVVTLNMSKIGYLTKDEKWFYLLLDKLLEASKRSLIIKAEFIEKVKDHYMPLSMEYGFNHERFFRTIGVLGLNEMCMNFHGKPLSEDIEFVHEVLTYIREWTRETQQETGVPWNFEITPGEGTSYEFAKIDYELYGNKIFMQGEYPECYYTAVLTPPNQDLGFFERIKIEEKLIPLFTGGTVCRLYVGDSGPSPEAVGKLIKRIAEHTEVAFFDLAITASICTECGEYHHGVVETCTVCGSPTKIWARVVGYYRPVENWNIGKQREFRERIHYNLTEIL